MKNLIYFFLFCLISSSCQNDVSEDTLSSSTINGIELSREELISIANDNPRDLTEEEALAMIDGFTKSLNASTRSGRRTESIMSGQFHIGSLQNLSTRSGLEDSILVYKIDLITDTVKGYALVSADSRSAGVMAYVEKGDLSKADKTGAE